MMNVGTASAHERARHGQGLIVSERFSAENNGNGQVVAVRPADGKVTVLTSGHNDVIPDLSPDGRNVVFERCFEARDCDQIGTINIWIMRADGTRARPLTSCDGTNCLGSFDPAFSPDGRHIAFAQDLLDARGVNFPGIFLMRTDGTALRRITSGEPDGFPDGHPAFSPDGKRIVFVREVADGRNQLMIVRSDGTGLHALMPGVDASGPNWSPDGRHIAFTLLRHTGNVTKVDVATVSPTGKNLRLLTDEPAQVRDAFEPNYSPSGRRIVFSENDRHGCDLVTISTTGDHSRYLTSGEDCYANATWGRG